jgi:chromosome segregation ATPase
MAAKLSTGQKLFIGLGSFFGAGYGGYYLAQMKEVKSLEKDKNDILKLIDSEKKRIVSSKKASEELNVKIVNITKASETAVKAVAEAHSKLDAARKTVQQLEAQWQERQKELKRYQDDLKSSQAKLIELAAEAERAKESVSMSEKSLVLASQKVDASRQLLNPLNHPKVKSLLGKE